MTTAGGFKWKYKMDKKEQYAVYEKIPKHGKDINGVILGPFNSKEEAEKSKNKYGYNTDNYFINKIK